MKTPSIQIHDAKRTVTTDHPQFPGLKTKVNAYRVKSVGKNGETLQTSEVLNDVKAVKTHVNAMCNCWKSDPHNPTFQMNDHTKEQKFAKSGYAIAAPQPKTKKA